MDCNLSHVGGEGLESGPPAQLLNPFRSALATRLSLAGERMRVRRRPTILLLLSLCLLSGLLSGAFSPGTADAASKLSRAERKAQKEAIQKLPEKYRQWLQVVDLLITEEEVTTFLKLEKDYERDAFIKRFWEVRDPIKSTSRNEFRDRWEASVEQALAQFGTLDDDRSRVMLLNGMPSARLEGHCASVIWPVEVWYFARAERTRSELIVVFYRHWGAGPYRVWSAQEGLGALFSGGAADSGTHDLQTIANGCRDGDKIAGAIGWVAAQGLGYSMLEAQMMSQPAGQ